MTILVNPYENLNLQINQIEEILIVETTEDQEIQSYEASIEFYYDQYPSKLIEVPIYIDV